jgi:proteasome assembly chaperone (PAC2) family protein
MQILVKFYNRNGSKKREEVFGSAEKALGALRMAGLDGFAHLIGTTSGGYNYDPKRQGHTLEHFQEVLDRCCNSVELYEKRLRAAKVYV